MTPDALKTQISTLRANLQHEADRRALDEIVGCSNRHQSQLQPAENKFHQGNGSNGKHYWLTPPALMEALQTEFQFDFDACPHPKPEAFDGLTCEWGKSTYANIPFGSIIHEGKKKGPTAWIRKAIAEHKKGKRVVLVYPVDKWLLMILGAGAKVRNLGDVRWCATEDGSQGKGTGRHIAAFILEPLGASGDVFGTDLNVHRGAGGTERSGQLAGSQKPPTLTTRAFIELGCPFCDEKDFDARGLKIHLHYGHCEPFNEINL